MSGYTRAVAIEQGMQRPIGPGVSGTNTNISPVSSVLPSTILTAGNLVSGALVLNVGVTGVVTDTAANYLLAFPEMNVGDSLTTIVTNLTAAAIVPTFGAGVTLVATGKPSFSIGTNFAVLTKSASPVTAYVLTIL